MGRGREEREEIGSEDVQTRMLHWGWTLVSLPNSTAVDDRDGVKNRDARDLGLICMFRQNPNSYSLPTSKA